MGDEEDTGTPVEEEEVAPESVDEETGKRRREGKREVNNRLLPLQINTYTVTVHTNTNTHREEVQHLQLVTRQCYKQEMEMERYK